MPLKHLRILTANFVGGIAVGLTNQMDYSRFARRPGDQVMGQWISIIGFGVVSSPNILASLLAVC